MENFEAVKYLSAILNTIDALLKSGGLHILGVEEVQQFSGCISALVQIRDSLEKAPQTETE